MKDISSLLGPHPAELQAATCTIYLVKGLRLVKSIFSSMALNDRPFPLFSFRFTTYFVSFPFIEDFDRGFQITEAETAVKFRICTQLGDLAGSEN